MSANNSTLDTSALYYTALGSMIDEYNEEISSPGFKLFAKYASHSSSTFRDAAVPKPIQNGAVDNVPTVGGMDNDRNVLNNIIAEPASSTPRRPVGGMRKHNLHSEHMLLALASKPSKAPGELSPRSTELKKAFDRALHERLLKKKIEDSKKSRRTTLRV